MRILNPRFFVAVAICSALVSNSCAQLQRVFGSGSDKIPEAVRLKGAVLIHTTQIFPSGPAGRVAQDYSLDQQLSVLFSNLEHILTAAGSSRSKVAHLNLYVVDIKDAAAVMSWVTSHYGDAVPSMSLISTPLPALNARVAADAVAARGGTPQKLVQDQTFHLVKRLPGGLPGLQQASLLSEHAIYISGMADTNVLPMATQKTLEKLGETLKQLHLAKENIIQLKAFFQPMTQSGVVLEAIQKFFQDQAPPTVLIEWDSPQPNPPIEIELIADATSLPASPERVAFSTPPGTTSTKVFSRVAEVDSDEVIYFSGLYGSRDAKATEQARELLHRIKGIAQRCDSDMEHLVKATYFVCDNPASEALNVVRPEFFNPARPPAASKAKVIGVGLSEKSLVIDMIAVPKGPVKARDHLPSTPAR
jgi:enamine deaminase RidA (YjgF/YER057c/UK114 family)